MTTTATTTRETATPYDLLCAIDEVLLPDFETDQRRVEMLETMMQAWLDVPARERKAQKEKTYTMATELEAARTELADARQWVWSRRIAGYSIGKLFIGEA